MLLDRLFSLLSPEEITAVLRGFGWTIQDYQRGYILKVGSIDTVVELGTRNFYNLAVLTLGLGPGEL